MCWHPQHTGVTVQYTNRCKNWRADRLHSGGAKRSNARCSRPSITECRNAILSILIVTICDISMPFLCHFVPFWNQSRVILVILCLFITSREPSTREHRHLHHVLHGEGGTERARRIPVRGGERLVMKAPGLNSWERNPSMRNLWRTHSFKLKHLKVRNRGVETVVCLWKPDFWLTCMSFHDTPCRDSNNACPSCECHGFRPWLGSAS